MRKTYTKPKFLFESFMMSTSIAAGCEEITTLHDADSLCGFNPDPRDNEYILFSSGQGSNCTSTPAGKYDSLCYHNPSDGYNLFTS